MPLAHPEDLLPLVEAIDTADITVTIIDKVTDRQNFYPFTSLVEFNREDGKYYVNKEATGDVAFTYYEYL